MKKIENMKNIIIGIVIGVLLMTTIAATTIGGDLLTFKPATPKSTIIKTYYNGMSPDAFISAGIKKGYQVQHFGTSNYYCTIVMVKY